MYSASVRRCAHLCPLGCFSSRLQANAAAVDKEARRIVAAKVEAGRWQNSV
jgi:hypothetical protein